MAEQQFPADMLAIFKPLDRWGPGSDTDTLEALRHVPYEPKTILDIGCGKGFSTSVLAAYTTAHITAVDSESSALDEMMRRIATQENCRAASLTPLCADMEALPLENSAFDLIWSESAAYNMGVENALREWKKLLRPDGILVFSDLVWFSHTPSKDASRFWEKQYPDLSNIATRLQQIKEHGYELVHHFALSQKAWDDYYLPLKQRIAVLQNDFANTALLDALAEEIDIYERYFGEFGYQLFVVRAQCHN